MPPETAAGVVIISPYPRLGLRNDGYSGVAGYTAHLAHALSDQGVDVQVVAPNEPGQPDTGVDGPVRVQRSFVRGRANSITNAFAAARRCDHPLVHLQHELFLYGAASGIPRLLLALAARRLRGRRTVVTMHQVIDPRTMTGAAARMHRVAVPAVLARIGLNAVQRLVPMLADRVIVHEPAFTRSAPGARLIPHGSHVVETGDADRRAARARLGVDDARLVALCFGFLAPYKGIEVALEAAAGITSSVHLVVAGGEHPRLAAEGDTYADELRTQHGEHALFTGYVDDAQVADWFRAADVALFCYPEPHASSGPLALALAHGTPVLVSRRLGEVMSADPRIVFGQSAAELAARLSRLAADPDERAALRDVSEQMALLRSWPEVAARHHELYAEVVGG